MMWCCDKRQEIYDGLIEEVQQPWLFSVSEQEVFDQLVDTRGFCPHCKFWLKNRYVIVEKSKLRRMKK